MRSPDSFEGDRAGSPPIRPSEASDGDLDPDPDAGRPDAAGSELTHLGDERAERMEGTAADAEQDLPAAASLSTTLDLPIVQLPQLRANPFDLRPLDPAEFGLLVGRQGLIEAWARHLRFSSPRHLLLVGERGSGRTSVLHALTRVTGSSVIVPLLPSGVPPVDGVLAELLAGFGGFDAPRSQTQLVAALAQRVAGEAHGTLPLVALDIGGLSGAEQGELLRQVLPVLRRLRALLVVTTTPVQHAAWPEGLDDDFDEQVRLAGLDASGIESLIETRLAPVTRDRWQPASSLVSQLLAETGGHVGHVMRLLRDVVDQSRGAAGPSDRLLRLHLRMEAERGQSEAHAGLAVTAPSAAWSDGSAPRIQHPEAAQVAPASPSAPRPSSSGAAEAPGVHADALQAAGSPSSPEPTPWPPEAERAPIPPAWEREPVHDGTHDHPPPMPPAGESPPEPRIWDDQPAPAPPAPEAPAVHWSDEPRTPSLPEPATRPPAAPASPPMPRPPLPGGAFRGLAGRNRQLEAEVGQQLRLDQDAAPGQRLPEHAPDPVLSAGGMRPEEANAQVEWWSADGEAPLPAPAPAPPSRGAPAAAFPPPITSGHAPSAAPPPAAVAERLVAAQQAAEAARDQPPLDVAHLQRLQPNELEVLRAAASREISPSDTELLERLGVRRPRLSQVCNLLHKSGILTVRREGRTRRFRLAPDAEAQLLAWGGAPHA